MTRDGQAGLGQMVVRPPGIDLIGFGTSKLFEALTMVVKTTIQSPMVYRKHPYPSHCQEEDWQCELVAKQVASLI